MREEREVEEEIEESESREWKERIGQAAAAGAAKESWFSSGGPASYSSLLRPPSSP